MFQSFRPKPRFLKQANHAEAAIHIFHNPELLVSSEFSLGSFVQSLFFLIELYSGLVLGSQRLIGSALLM